MNVKILAALAALFLGLAIASEAQAAGCNCGHVRHQGVAHRHAPVVRTQIVYGDPRPRDRQPYVAPAYYGGGYAPNQLYYEPPVYSAYDYGYAAPVVYGQRWGGYYRPYYGYRPYGYARYGWPRGYHGGAYRGNIYPGSAYRGAAYRTGAYGGGRAVYVGGAGWRR